MHGINHVTLLGNVGQDPEIRTNPSTGQRIASLSLATSETWKDKATGERKESTEWHRVVIFNDNIVKVVESFVKKGSRIWVQGKIKTRKWQDKTGADRWSTEIVLGNFDGHLGLEGSPGGGAGKATDPNAYGQTRTREAGSAAAGGGSGSTSGQRPELDDDIPF